MATFNFEDIFKDAPPQGDRPMTDAPERMTDEEFSAHLDGLPLAEVLDAANGSDWYSGPAIKCLERRAYETAKRTVTVEARLEAAEKCIAALAALVSEEHAKGPLAAWEAAKEGK